MEINTLQFEFNCLIEIAQEIVLDRSIQSLSVEDFLQLCLDIRNDERTGNKTLKGKNIVILPDNTLTH